jgi:hypothetical protein
VVVFVACLEWYLLPKMWCFVRVLLGDREAGLETVVSRLVVRMQAVVLVGTWVLLRGVPGLVRMFQV